MKKLLLVTVMLAFALSLFALAYAEGQPTLTPPPPATDQPPPPPPPPPPPVVEKVVKIVLTPKQVKAVKAATAGADVTLTKNQLAAVKKEWKDFKGTTTKAMAAHIYKNNKIDLTMKDGALMCTAHVAPPPPPAKDKSKSGK